MKWITLFAGAAGIIGSGVQEPLTMERAVDIATKNAFAIRLAQSETERVEANAEAAEGQLGPQVAVNGNYQYFGDAGSFGFGSTGGGGSSGGTTGGGFGGGLDDLLQIRLVVSQLIDISGGVRSGVRALELAARAVEVSEIATVNLVKGGVRNAYLTALRAGEQLGVRQQEVEAASARLENARLRFDAGAIPEFDVLRLETELRRAEEAVITADNALQIAKQQLNQAMARPIETPIELSPVSGVPETPLQPDQLVELGWNSRSELLALGYQLESAQSAVDAEEAANDPSLMLSANYGRILNAGEGIPESSSSISAVLNWTLYDSGTAEARAEAAEEVVQQTRIRLEEQRLQIALEVRRAYANLQSAEEVLATAQRTEGLAAESLRLAQLRFDAGEGILLDVIAAQTELTRARAAVVDARYGYLGAYAALQQAVGRDALSL